MTQSASLKITQHNDQAITSHPWESAAVNDQSLKRVDITIIACRYTI